MKTISNLIKIGLIGAFALGTTSAALAGTNQRNDQKCTVRLRDRGAIRGIDLKSQTLTLQDQHQATLGIEWNQQTRFFDHGKTITAADLKSGERVGVTYVKEGDHLVARAVAVMPDHPMMAHTAKHSS